MNAAFDIGPHVLQPVVRVLVRGGGVDQDLRFEVFHASIDEIGVGDAAVKVFGAKALGPDGKCETEAKDSAKCNTPAT